MEFRIQRVRPVRISAEARNLDLYRFCMSETLNPYSDTPRGSMNTVIYYKCEMMAGPLAGVAKSGQRRWIQGPVS